MTGPVSAHRLWGLPALQSMVLVDSERILDLLPPPPPSLNLYVTTHVSLYVSSPSPQP